jgi:hypothetical protein
VKSGLAHLQGHPKKVAGQANPCDLAQNTDLDVSITGMTIRFVFRSMQDWKVVSIEIRGRNPDCTRIQISDDAITSFVFRNVLFELGVLMTKTTWI